MIVSRVLGFLLVLGYLRVLRKPISSIGLHARNFNSALLIGMLSLVLLYVVLYGVQFYRLSIAGQSPRLIFAVIVQDSGALSGIFFTLFFLCGQFCNAFMEEAIFRGVMLPYFMRRLRFWQANALQAFLFGLAHLVFPLYFARISDSNALYTAFHEGTLTAETVARLRPNVDVLRLRPGSNKPEVWLVNATQFTLASAAP